MPSDPPPWDSIWPGMDGEDEPGVGGGTRGREGTDLRRTLLAKGSGRPWCAVCLVAGRDGTGWYGRWSDRMGKGIVGVGDVRIEG